MLRGNGAAGVRCSAFDGAVIVLCALATWWGWPAAGSVVLLLPVVLGHFFLFCNVFRIRREFELIWAGIFLANFGTWAAAEAFAWWGLLAIQTPVTVALIVAELRSPHYHGIGWQRVNPGYPARVHVAGDEWLS